MTTSATTRRIHGTYPNFLDTTLVTSTLALRSRNTVRHLRLTKLLQSRPLQLPAQPLPAPPDTRRSVDAAAPMDTHLSNATPARTRLTSSGNPSKATKASVNSSMLLTGMVPSTQPTMKPSTGPFSARRYHFRVTDQSHAPNLTRTAPLHESTRARSFPKEIAAFPAHGISSITSPPATLHRTRRLSRTSDKWRDICSLLHKLDPPPPTG
jgi:hypothetical protein